MSKLRTRLSLVVLILGGVLWQGATPGSCEPDMGYPTRPGAPPSGGSAPDVDGLRVLLLADPGAEGDVGPWEDVLGEAGFVVTVDASLAGAEPSVTELGDIAEDYDVALLPADVDPDSYASAVWNDLPIGVVTTSADMARGDRWDWLDVGTATPSAARLSDLRILDRHSVLRGVTAGDRADVPIYTDGSVARSEGFTGAATDLGIVALHFEAGGDLAASLVLWEPGPFFTGSTGLAAARRALFAMGSPSAEALPALTDDGHRILIQTLEWAARPGQPVDPDPDFDPVGIFLTWQADPTTTLTIDWHTLPGENRTEVRYWIDGTGYVQTATGSTHPFPHSDRTIHRVALTDLQPDTLYAFDMGEGSRIFRFRTLPETAEDPITFIAAGDVRESQWSMERAGHHALRHDPAFIAWGGDLAYADGRADRVGRWVEFFDAIRNSLITREGRIVPIVVAIGNHEVQEGYYSRHSGYEPTDAWRERIAPYFYALFAFPGHPGYGTLDFGDYLSLIVLDTDHSGPLRGEQTIWLEQVLAERSDVPHVFPLYHVPAYPSHRELGGTTSTRVRDLWVPLFERYGVRTAFENHDHTYKRTEPILDGEIHPDGIVFLGDGAWGVSPRPVHGEWYLASARSVRHFIVGTVHGDAQRFRAFDDSGRLFDSVDR